VEKRNRPWPLLRESVKFNGKVPPFEISINSIGHCKLDVWNPTTWRVASKLLRIGERQRKIMVTDPKDFAALQDEHERIFGNDDA